MRLRLSSLCLLSLVLTLAACTSLTPTGARRSTPSPRPAAVAAPVVYAALGASETVGVGVGDHLRQAWPQIFFNIALPDSAVFYNFGFPGATTADALQLELPAAIGVHPTIVTIWLNVNDLIAGVSPVTYETELQQLVQRLRAAGTREILIANTPYLDRLPAYLSCNAPSGSLHCPFPAEAPTAAQLNAMVDAYNAGIQCVAAEESAVVVDLHTQGELPDLHPDYLSADGLHPNARGYAAIASAFKAALAGKTP